MDVFVVLLLSGFCVPAASFQYKYYFISQNMTWTKARAYCIKEYTELAQISNEQNNTAVKNSPTGGYTGKAWIGLKNKSPDPLYSDWLWLENGETSTFVNWGAGQPVSQTGDTACATIVVNSGTWTSELCTAQYPFFCYDVYRSKKRVVSMNIQTDADLENPDNQGALMQQLQASLGQQGVTDFKLTWTTQPVQKIGETVKEPC